MSSNWACSLEIRDGDLDYLGHVTSARYLDYFELARVDWLSHRLHVELPSYAVVSQHLDYLQEIRADGGPLRVEITLRRMGTASFDVDERLLGPDGTVHCTSKATLVSFDPQQRRARPLTDVERRALQLPVDAAQGA